MGSIIEDELTAYERTIASSEFEWIEDATRHLLDTWLSDPDMWDTPPPEHMLARLGEDIALLLCRQRRVMRAADPDSLSKLFRERTERIRKHYG